jgi:ribosomal subunit interface protein
MKQPLQLQFLGMEPSEAVAAAVREKAAKLDQFRADLMACRVVVEHLNKHKQQGRQFAVRLDVTLPGHEISVDRVQHEDVYVALRDAFDDMKRRIEDGVRQTRGDVKQHPQMLHGEVVRFDAEGRYGFIRSADGDEYWFGPDNMGGGVPFDHVGLGAEVRFIAEVAGEGRQAKRVSLGKHHAE